MAKKKTQQVDEDLEIHLPGTAGDDFGSGEIGQIRTLLMGQHSREMIERVERVESELMAALETMTAAIDRRLTEIDKRIEQEAADRQEVQIDLRNEVEQQSVEIRHQIGSAQMELKEQIENVDATLRERHVDRYTLSGFFEQAAADLTRDQ